MVTPSVGDMVRMTDELTLIVWEPKTNTEHFVRTVSFDGDASKFGFLVPTPTPPQIAEANPEVFEHLNTAATPPAADYGSDKGMGSAPAAAGGVQVLDRVSVGQMDAVVLKAAAGDSIKNWLEQNGFQSREALVPWLNHYAKLGWTITAFRYAPGQAATTLNTSAVRLSFSTPTPIYPYLEPADAPQSSRWMRLYVIAPTFVKGFLTKGGAQWEASPAQAPPLSSSNVFEISRLSGVQVSENSKLTTFNDYSQKRPASDLQFLTVKEPASSTGQQGTPGANSQQASDPTSWVIPVVVSVSMVILLSAALLLTRRR